MYKRINKRIRRKEKEEALGLDGETKDMLGIPETDSDESDSSDEEQSDSGSEESGVEGKVKLGTRRRGGPKQLSESGGSDVGILSGAETEDSEEDEDEDEEMVGSVDEDEDEPPMTISEALKNSLYSIRKGSEAQACVLCPGKELKHAKMASVHVQSSSHLRRMKRFTTLATRVGDEEEDPRLLVAALDESVRITPKEKVIKVSDGPKVPRKERLIAKRERRRERRAAQQPDEQVQEKQTNKAQPNTKSDRVLEKKTLNRHSEAIAKHKVKSKHSRLHKSSKAKNSAI
ncbi:unnamed protein product [Rhizoctonia solani]|uniref:Uncharacterized protein n=3 Tax=Rhizoctonia solani TaxID=456999 RepID=A0A8H3B8J8_9AGAM|nr:hypothetical protein RSOL_207470 [Rhizoctonia solani AG-3 Rhs1AP]KEP52738.1 hypothetical protein V565_040790 [Rhizoctonia solani 123E]CAE6450711.1 unnamed protein product [Rhizoctonia solani]CAE6531632.1 unnamed protein product [Rhizoctonia solani]